MLGGSFGGGLIRASVGGGFGGGERGGSGSRARTGQRGSVITTTTTIMMTGSSSSGGDVDSSSNNSSGGGDGVGVDVGVGSVGGGVWDAQEEEEWEFEEEVQALEKRLEKAVKKEDYKGAALYRDELYRYAREREGANVMCFAFLVCRVTFTAYLPTDIYLVPTYFILILFFFSTLSLSSFWTSRGHRCHPFSSPILAFNFYRA